MLADLLAAVELCSDEELDRLAVLFHNKLLDAVSLREGPVGARLTCWASGSLRIAGSLGELFNLYLWYKFPEIGCRPTL